VQRFSVQNEIGETHELPSEDLLYELILELDEKNSSLVVEAIPADGLDCYVSVARSDGGYEMVYKNSSRGEHRVVCDSSPDKIARDMMGWMNSI